MKVSMTLERETKGAIRYKEVDERGHDVDMQNAILGTLYIRKRAFDDVPAYPMEITVSITEGNSA